MFSLLSHAKLYCVSYVLFQYIYNPFALYKFQFHTICTMHIVRTWWLQQSCFLVAEGIPVCSPLWHHSCDVIENNSIGNNAAIPLADKFKLLMNINEWIAHFPEKHFMTTPLNPRISQEYGWWSSVPHLTETLHENVFHITCPLKNPLVTGGLPSEVACNVELCIFLWYELAADETVKSPPEWETMTLMWHCWMP